MKYCAKCGTQIPDETLVCPQCSSETNTSQLEIFSENLPSQKKNPSKNSAFIIPNAILTTISLISLIITLFTPHSANNSNSSPNTTLSDNYSNTCPADEYGYHDWSPARCTYPAHCYECGAYKDDILGEHSFYTDDDGLCDCSYCGILYEVYIASLN